MLSSKQIGSIRASFLIRCVLGMGAINIPKVISMSLMTFEISPHLAITTVTINIGNRYVMKRLRAK